MSDFQHWLNTATRGLPAAIAELVVDEFTDHYKQALADYLEDGLSVEAAHRAAFADLGSPRQAGRMLRETHAPYRRLYLAAFASIIPALMLLVLVAPFLLMLNVNTAGWVGVLLMFGVLSTAGVLAIITTPYVLRSFRLIFDMQDVLAIPATLVQFCLLALVIPYILTMLNLDTEGFIGVMILTNDPVAFFSRNTGTTVDFYQLYIAMVLVLLGFAWLLAGVRLTQVDRSYFYGLYYPICLLFLGTGFCIAMQGISLSLNNLPWVQFTGALVAILGPVKAAACTLLFYRAASHHNSTPTLMA